jgi:hypothetical protein
MNDQGYTISVLLAGGEVAGLSVSARSEAHETTEAGGVARMQPLSNGPGDQSGRHRRTQTRRPPPDVHRASAAVETG